MYLFKLWFGKYVSSKLGIRCLSGRHTTISSCSWFIRFSWFRLVPREIGAEKAVRGLPFYFPRNFVSPSISTNKKELQTTAYNSFIFSGEYRNRTDDLLTASQTL